MKPPCSVETCDRVEYARGYCTPHYQRLLKHGDVMADVPVGRTRKPCTVEGCDRMAEARGMCMTHYSRVKAHGSVDKPTPRVRRRKPKTQCSVDSCDRDSFSKGMCKKHYTRTKKHGSPNVIGKSGRPALERPICSAPGCDKQSVAAGRPLCSAHYYRWQKYGNPEEPARRFTDPEAAFAARTRRDGDCLIWTGSKTSHDYGVIRYQGREIMAHRYAWIREYGSIPDDIDLDHRCHRHPCVEVRHLRPADAVTNAQNILGTYSHNKSSGVRGVSWNKARKKWEAYITYRGKRTRLGYYANKADAAAASLEARLRVYTHNDEDRGLGVTSGES